MNNRYKKTFKFFDTEEEAKIFLASKPVIIDWFFFINKGELK
jgi:hypothetical protein